MQKEKRLNKNSTTNTNALKTNSMKSDSAGNPTYTENMTA